MSRTMKDSGIPWIGEIPEKWQLVPSKRLFKGVKRIVGKDVEKYERLALTMQGVIRRNKEDNEGLQPEKFDGYQILEQNNLVFKLIDLQNTKTSRVGLSPYTGIVSPAYIIIANGEKDNRFYYYWFLDMYYRLIFNQMGDEGVRSSLSMADVLSIPIPSISMTEQQTIADFLDKKCTEIDELISLQDKIIEELKAYKQSVITEAVTKGLNPDVQMKESGIGWMGKIPNTWSVKRLKSFALVLRGGSPRPIEDYISEEGYNWIKIGDTIKGNKYINSVKQKIKQSGLSKTREVHIGDLILTNSMSFGEPYILNVDGCIHDGWVAISNLNGIDKEFLYYFFSSTLCKMQFDLQVAGGVVQNLNVEKVASTLVVTPPLSEQQAIADYLDKKCAEIDSLIALKQDKIEYLKEYKKSIIYEYTTGKKEVVQ